jgi:hypothetical protein
MNSSWTRGLPKKDQVFDEAVAQVRATDVVKLAGRHRDLQRHLIEFQLQLLQLNELSMDFAG